MVRNDIGSTCITFCITENTTKSEWISAMFMLLGTTLRWFMFIV